MTVAPARPGDTITLNADGTLSGSARGVPFAKDAQASRGAGARQVGRSRWSRPTACRLSDGTNLASEPLEHRHLRSA